MKPPSAQKEPDILQNYVYFSITSLDWTYQRWWRCLAKPAWPVYQNQDPLSSVCSNPGGLPKRRKVHHGPTPRHSIHFVYCERARWKLSRWACRQAGAPPPPPAPVTSLLQDGSLGRKGHSHLTKGREANDSPGPHSLANQRRGTRTQVSQAPVGLGLPTRRKPEPAALRAPAACLPTGGSTSGWKAALSEEGGRGHAAPRLPHSQPALRRPRGPEAETQGERSPEPSPPTHLRGGLTLASTSATAAETRLPASSSRKKPLTLPLDWLRELSFNRGSSPASDRWLAIAPAHISLLVSGIRRRFGSWRESLCILYH